MPWHCEFELGTLYKQNDMSHVHDSRCRRSRDSVSNDANCMETRVHRLCDEIEAKLGYGMNSPTEFRSAAESITVKTGRSISPTTLMRIWGYLRDTGANYTPTTYSLSTLAIFLGYLDFGRFALQSTNDGESQATPK